MLLGRGIDRWIGFEDLPRQLTLLIGIAKTAAATALVPVILLLVAAILVNPALLFRQPVPTGAKRECLPVLGSTFSPEPEEARRPC